MNWLAPVTQITTTVTCCNYVSPVSLFLFHCHNVNHLFLEDCYHNIWTDLSQWIKSPPLSPVAMTFTDLTCFFFPFQCHNVNHLFTGDCYHNIWTDLHQWLKSPPSPVAIMFHLFLCSFPVPQRQHGRLIITSELTCTSEPNHHHCHPLQRLSLI